MVGGIETPSSGTIAIVDSKTSRREPIGASSIMMWQELNLFPWRNVIDNVAFGLEMAGLRAPNGMRAPAPCSRPSVLPASRHLPRALSGGMRQRVALARALSWSALSC